MSAARLKPAAAVSACALLSAGVLFASPAAAAPDTPDCQTAFAALFGMQDASPERIDEILARHGDLGVSLESKSAEYEQATAAHVELLSFADLYQDAVESTQREVAEAQAELDATDPGDEEAVAAARERLAVAEQQLAAAQREREEYRVDVAESEETVRVSRQWVDVIEACGDPSAAPAQTQPDFPAPPTPPPPPPSAPSADAVDGDATYTG